MKARNGSPPVERKNYAASHPTLRVSAKRFAWSPFLDCCVNENAVFGIYSRRLYLLTLGEDPVADYWTLRRNAVLYYVPERPLEIAGPDAGRLLDRVLTRNVAGLRRGRALYSPACFPDGGIMMDGVLMRLAADRFWYVVADGEVHAWLIAHGMELDVTIRDPASWVLQVQGPRSLDILAAACDGGPPDPFPYFAVSKVSMAGQPLLASRSGWTGELGFELYTLDQDPDAPALWDHLMNAGRPHGMISGSLESMGIRRVEAGILDNGTDMDPTMTPFQAGLGRFVDMTKPDFIGKKALEKSDKRCLLYGIKCAGATPMPGMSIVRDRTPVGRVTVGAWSPFLDHGVGYARLNRPGDWVGATVSMASSDGTSHRAEIVSLPFYDREKRIARGLDTGVA